MTFDKIVDKIRKLKAHADSAELIGNEAEAEAFAEMFQKMMLEHKVEMTDLEFEEFEKTEPVEKHRINYTQYPDIKLKNARVQWIERLAGVIARAHFCRILVHPGSSRITLVGRKQDSLVVEYMFITLQRVAARMSYLEYGKYNRECMRRDGNAHGAHGFREAWLQSFIMRLAERYEAEKNSQKAAGCTALVRFNAADAAVDDYMKEFKKKASALATVRSWNGEGHRRGRAAADSINLNANAVTSGGDHKRLK